MLLWIGLAITWLAAIVSVAKDLKWEPSGRRLSRVFLKTNRFSVALGILATAGFVVGGITTELDRRAGRKAKDDLIVTLLSKEITAIFDFYFGTSSDDLSWQVAKKPGDWEQAQAGEAVSRPSRFLPGSLRRVLFPGWTPSGVAAADLYVGGLNFFSGPRGFQILVRPDGRVDPIGSLFKSLDVVSGEQWFVLRIILSKPYTSASIWHDLQQRADEQKPILSASMNRTRIGGSTHGLWHSALSRAYLRAYLTDTPETFAWVPLRGAKAELEGEGIEFSWLASQRPEIKRQVVEPSEMEEWKKY